MDENNNLPALTQEQAQIIPVIIQQMMGPLVEAMGKMLENNTQALNQLAATQQIQADRLEALEKQIRLNTLVTPQQVKYINDAIRTRARELLDKRGVDDKKAVTKLGNAVRKALLSRYGVGALHDIPKHEYVNLERHIEIIKEATMRRKLLAVADEISQLVMDKGVDVTAITDDARAKLRNMVQAKSAWQSTSDVLIATMSYLEKLQKGEIVGIKSGVADVDRATGGFFPGELAIVGARPSVGKSAFGLQIAIDAASKGHKVCFVSCEMVDSQFGQRLLSNSAQIDGMKLRNAEINDEDWIQIAEALGLLGGLPISFTFG